MPAQTFPRDERHRAPIACKIARAARDASTGSERLAPEPASSTMRRSLRPEPREASTAAGIAE